MENYNDGLPSPVARVTVNKEEKEVIEEMLQAERRDYVLRLRSSKSATPSWLTLMDV